MIRGLGGNDEIFNGLGDDVVYAGPGNDNVSPESGDDVIYGGPGNDRLSGYKLYCGKGKDTYVADKKDFVDNSCEKRVKNLGLPA